MIMSNLPEEEILHYAAQMQCQSVVSMNGELTHEGWKHMPVTVIVTEDDQCLPPKKQHSNVDAAIASGKGKIRKISVLSDHCAMISHPDEIVDIVVEAARADL
jgi:pimeloyl-ACP methyl ester carboxylesterase